MSAIHTEACYADGCGGHVIFSDRRGVCPTCGTAQRVEPPARAIYTAGYMHRSLSSLIAKVRGLTAVLIDIRYAARSKYPQWEGDNLRLVFGDDYRHIAALGNVNYKNCADGIRIYNLKAGVEEVLKLNRAAVLLCGCAKPSECHRSVVAQAIRERGHNVSELEW
jgi:uncharacterized protein (DUF488 family)